MPKTFQFPVKQICPPKGHFWPLRVKPINDNDMLYSVFIYSMPGYSVSIKERMLYSSCKNFVVDIIDKQYNIQIHKKIEIDAGSELTEEFLMVRHGFRLYKTFFRGGGGKVCLHNYENS